MSIVEAPIERESCVNENQRADSLSPVPWSYSRSAIEEDIAVRVAHDSAIIVCEADRILRVTKNQKRGSGIERRVLLIIQKICEAWQRIF